MKLPKLLFAYFLVLLFSPILVFARGWHHQPVQQTPPSLNQAPPPVQSSAFQWGAFTGDSSVLGTWKGVFIGDGDSFTEDFGQYKVPLVVYWESSLTAQQIANGNSDSFISTWAAQMKTYGQPIIFAPLDEMNGNWNPYSGNPTVFKAAWVRIHTLFSSDSNVKFAYDPNVCGPGIPCSTFGSYYPGSNLVDIVGLDGFDFGGQTYSQVFSGSMAAIQSLGKPLWITSTGVVNTDNQAKFISDMAAATKQYGIQGIVYFDYQQFVIPDSTLEAL